MIEIRKGRSVILVGPKGEGKTEFVHKYAEDFKNVYFFDVNRVISKFPAELHTYDLIVITGLEHTVNRGLIVKQIFDSSNETQILGVCNDTIWNSRTYGRFVPKYFTPPENESKMTIADYCSSIMGNIEK